VDRLAPRPARLSEPGPGLLLENGRFWTADPRRPRTSALAILGDRIVALGEEAVPAAGPRARRIDLGGRFVLPGFIDNHVHLRDGSLRLSRVRLRGVRTREEFTRVVAEHASGLAPEAWVLGGGWDHESWGGALPTRAWIDEAAGGRPALLHRLDGHLALASSGALAVAGLDRGAEDPPGGSLVRGADGELTGVLKDAAIAPVERRIPAPGRDELLRALEAGLAHAASVGVTSVHDVSHADDPSLLAELLLEGRLTLRVACRHPIERTSELRAVGVSAGQGGAWLRVGAVKMFADGSLGASTAAFLEPYADDPANRGLEMHDPAELHRALAEADRARLQLSVHAIGDLAIRRVLDVFERIARENPAWDRRWRIEHVQHPAAADVPRLAALGVTASMQPAHAADDGRWMERRIGRDRARTSYPFRTLIDAGVAVTFGSDWPVAPLDPLAGFDAAVNRRTLDGANPGGWFPEQRVTVEEALLAYTRGNARAVFEEGEKGMLAPGFLADLVVLDRDPFEIPRGEVGQLRVGVTIVGGRVVYEGGV
jgi:predicted amidohydrolase YtcJ